MGEEVRGGRGAPIDNRWLLYVRVRSGWTPQNVRMDLLYIIQTLSILQSTGKSSSGQEGEASSR